MSATRTPKNYPMALAGCRDRNAELTALVRELADALDGALDVRSQPMRDLLARARAALGDQ